MKADDPRVLALAAAIVGFVDALDARHSAQAYDADRLPPGATRDAYLRRHRSRVREGIAGWTRVGAARLVTATAWQADVQAETIRRSLRAVPAAPVVANVDDLLDRELGIRARRSA